MYLDLSGQWLLKEETELGFLFVKRDLVVIIEARSKCSFYKIARVKTRLMAVEF